MQSAFAHAAALLSASPVAAVAAALTAPAAAAATDAALGIVAAAWSVPLPAAAPADPRLCHLQQFTCTSITGT